MRTASLATALTFVAFSAVAQECTDLARVIGREASRFGNSEQVDILNKSNLCTERYDSATSEQRASISAAYGLFSSGASGSSNQIRAMQDKMCQGQYGSYWGSLITSIDIQKVSQVGADIVRACINSRSFRLIGLTIQDDAFSSTFRYGGAGETVVNGIALIPSSIGRCVVRVNGREHTDLGRLAGTKLNSGETLAVDCQRSGESVDGSSPNRKRYRGGLLSVVTQAEGVSVPFIEYSVPAAPEPALERLEREIKEANAKSAHLQQQISLLNSRLSQVALNFIPVPGPHNGLFDMAGVGQEGNCPGTNQVVIGFRNSQNHALDMWRCVALQISIPK